MKPRAIGRFLGIGVRVAKRVAGERITANTSSPETSTQYTAMQNIARVETAVRTSKEVGRGVAGFLRPFQRVGGIIWLQVTGVFFMLPVLVFSPILWRTHTSALHGPDQKTFWITAVIVIVFFYLSVTAFWRARKR